MIYMGHCLQDNDTLHDYNITTNSTIIINLRLRSGCSGTSSKNIGSFKEQSRVKGKRKPIPQQPLNFPGPTLLNKKIENPSLTIAMPEVNALYSDIYSLQLSVDLMGFGPDLMICTTGSTPHGHQTAKFTYAPKASS